MKTCSSEGEMICPVGDRFECFNVQSDLENCGGCSTGENPTGKDCTVAEGAFEVEVRTISVDLSSFD
jgi:hypothetical protein